MALSAPDTLFPYLHGNSSLPVGLKPIRKWHEGCIKKVRAFGDFRRRRDHQEFESVSNVNDLFGKKRHGREFTPDSVRVRIVRVMEKV